MNNLAPPSTNALAPRSLAGFGQNVRTGLRDFGLGMVDAGKLLGEHAMSNLVFVGRPGEPTRLTNAVTNALGNPTKVGRAVLNHLGRYAPQNIGNTLYNEPVGVLTDALDLYTGGMTGAGKVARVLAAYQHQPLDLGNVVGKRFYHGTKAPIQHLGEADPEQFSRIESLYGPGLYLTDSPDIAQGYAHTRGSGSAGKVHAADLGDVRLIDLGKPLPDDALAAISRLHIDGGPLNLPRGITGDQAIRRLKEAMWDAEIPKSDVVEIYQEMSQNLIDVGYDGFHHIGGGRTKAGKEHGPHNVVILWPNYRPGRQVTEKFKPHIEAPTPPKPSVREPSREDILRKLRGY